MRVREVIIFCNANYQLKGSYFLGHEDDLKG